MDEQLEPTVTIEEYAPFDLNIILSAARRHGLAGELLNYIEETFKTPEIADLIDRSDLTMPFEIAQRGKSLSFQWHLSEYAFEIRFDNFFSAPVIYSALIDISTGGYTEMFSMHIKGAVEVLARYAQERNKYEKTVVLIMQQR